MNAGPVTEGLDTKTVLGALMAFRDGDFSVRLPVDETGVAGKNCDTLNHIFRMNARMPSELARIGTAAGKEGKINKRARGRYGRQAPAARPRSVEGRHLEGPDR